LVHQERPAARKALGLWINADTSPLFDVHAKFRFACRGKFVERRRRKATGLRLGVDDEGSRVARRIEAAAVRAAGSDARSRTFSSGSILVMGWLASVSCLHIGVWPVFPARSKFSLLLFLCAYLAAVLAYSAEYFVSPDGNDGNAGTSASRPWKTIAKANATLQPGDTVYLRGGTYNDDPIRP